MDIPPTQRSYRALLTKSFKTRITTKYNIPNLDSPKYQKVKKRKRDGEGDEKDSANTARMPRATLTLKTFDPESGVVLKFKTDRAAEVGRLISSLGRVGRHMAALPEKDESESLRKSDKAGRVADPHSAQDVPMDDAPEAEQGGVSLKEATPAANDAKPQQGGGGGKKKKKNKK